MATIGVIKTAGDIVEPRWMQFVMCCLTHWTVSHRWQWLLKTVSPRSFGLLSMQLRKRGGYCDHNKVGCTWRDSGKWPLVIFYKHPEKSPYHEAITIYKTYDAPLWQRSLN